MTEKMDDDRLKALLSQEISSSLTYDKTELAQKRARNLEYLRGEMNDTPAMAGRSSVVSMDVADTIGWMLPGIIRVFTASDVMVSYEPEKPGDEAFSKQASEYANFVFMRDNPGYRILWDGTHDSLALGNAVIKHWWDDKEECEYTEHSGLTEEQIAVLQQDNDEVEIVAQKPGEPQMILVPGPTGELMEMPIETFDVKVKRVVRTGRLKVECIEPEDFLLSREATQIEGARFVAHRQDVTRSDLIEMGFDRQLVMDLPVDRFSSMLQEKISRDEESQTFFNNVGDESMLMIELFECYIKADADGDGIAETVRAYYAGSHGSGELLDWEVWEDDVPFSDIPCEPIPHRWDARSVADDTSDIQRVKTVITRQFLDNTYWVNNPMTTAEEKSVVNPEMLRNPRFGGTVYHKAGSLPPAPMAIPYIGDKALLALQHFDQVREMRTGVSRSTMALDPEALQNQTATASQNQKDSAYSQIELIARNQAELGWKRVFKQILKLIVKHQDRPRTIRLRDTWVEMDPRSWNANMDATINVGLGTGSRDRDMAMLNQILNVQIAMTDRLAQSGFSSQALEMVPKINMTATKLAESAGIKNPDQFYLDIKPEMLEQMKQEAANRPDPEMQKEQMKAQTATQLEQIKAQTALTIGQQDAQLAAQADERKAQIEAVQMQADIEQQNKKAEAEMIKAQQQFELDKELALLEFQLQRELKMAELEIKRELAQQQMAQNAEQHRQQMEAGAFKVGADAQAHEQKMKQGEAKPAEKSEPAKPRKIKFTAIRGEDGKLAGMEAEA